jgi:tetratricopeptide (TPR) repeat protein
MQQHKPNRTWWKVITAITCLLAAQFCLAQTMLRGVLLKDSDGGDPFKHIQINAIESSKGDISTSDGIFLLPFNDKRPGDEVNLIIRYPEGWRVLFSVMLKHPLPKPDEAKPGQTPSKVIACQDAQCELLRTEFLKRNNLAIVDKRYEQKLVALKKKTGVQQHEFDSLTAELAKERDRVADLAKQFARLAEGEVSLLYRQAWDLYLAGELDQALEVISELRLEQEEAAINKRTEILANTWLLRGEIANLNNNFDAAGRAYDKAVALAPKSFSAWLAYGVFHSKLNHFREARNGFEQCLALAQQAKNLANVAVSLNNLGISHENENRLPEARKAQEEALTIHRQLAAGNPQAFLQDVATSLSNLGLIHRHENRLPEARKAQEEALTIRRELATGNPQAFLPDVAASLNNLGNIHQREERLPEARKVQEEALTIYRQLAAGNPKVFLQDVATSLSNLGNIHRLENRLPEARKAQEEALTIRRELATGNPQAFLPNVATSLINLGLIHQREKRLPEARKTYEDALTINRELAAGNPQAFLPLVARTTMALGLLHYLESNPTQARQLLQEALTIFQRFATQSLGQFSGEIEAITAFLATLPPPP